MLIIGFAIFYGINVSESAAPQPGPRIALIQGNTPADWKMDAERQQEIMREYVHSFAGRGT